MIADLIVILVIALLVIGAIVYMKKQKKQGGTCGSCPRAGTCAKKRQGGCQ